MLEHVGEQHRVNAGDALGYKVDRLGRSDDDAVDALGGALRRFGNDLDADREDPGQRLSPPRSVAPLPHPTSRNRRGAAGKRSSSGKRAYS